MNAGGLGQEAADATDEIATCAGAAAVAVAMAGAREPADAEPMTWCLDLLAGRGVAATGGNIGGGFSSSKAAV